MPIYIIITILQSELSESSTRLGTAKHFLESLSKFWGENGVNYRIKSAVKVTQPKK